MMGPCRQQCSGRRLTQTGTSILSHTTLWLTRQQWPAPCLLEQTGSAWTSQTRQRKRSICPSAEDECVSQRIGHQELGTHSTPPPTWGVRHTQSQSGPSVCPTLVRDNTEDLDPLGCLHLLSASAHRPSDFGAPKVPHTFLRQRAGVVYWILCGSCEKVYIVCTVLILI